MFDDLSALFYENLWAAYKDFCKVESSGATGQSKNLRSAIDAATALFHFHEHIQSPHYKSGLNIAAECPEFGLLGDIANAAKHRNLTRGTLLIANASDLSELTTIIEFEDEDGIYTHSETTVSANCTDGKLRDVGIAIAITFNYWGKKLAEWQVLPKFSPVAIPISPEAKFVSRNDAKGLNLSANREVRLRQNMQLLRWDNSAGRAAPVDHAGGALRVRFYQPEYLLDLIVNHPVHGELTVTVPITAEDSQELAGAASEAELEAAQLRIAENHRETLFALAARAMAARVQGNPAP